MRVRCGLITSSSGRSRVARRADNLACSGRSSVSGETIESDVLPRSYGSESHRSAEARRQEYVSRHDDVTNKAEYVRRLKERAQLERERRDAIQARKDARAREYEVCAR